MHIPGPVFVFRGAQSNEFIFVLLTEEIVASFGLVFKRHHVEVELREDGNAVESLQNDKLLVILTVHDLAIDTAERSHDWNNFRTEIWTG